MTINLTEIDKKLPWSANFKRFSELADGLLYVPNNASEQVKDFFIFQNIKKPDSTKSSHTSKYPISGDYQISTNTLFPKLNNHPDLGRIFNPGIQYINNNLHLILRYNRLQRELGSANNYLPGHKYYVKNNSLIYGILNQRDLSIKNGMGMLIDPFQENSQKQSFDCESNPDWTDGGHGPQDPRIFEYQNEYFMIFNDRKQEKEKSIACPENQLQRKLYIAKLILDPTTKIMTGWEKAMPLELLDDIQVPWRSKNPNGPKETAERNWSPFTDYSNGRLLLVYCLDPLIILSIDLKNIVSIFLFFLHVVFRCHQSCHHHHRCHRRRRCPLMTCRY